MANDKVNQLRILREEITTALQAVIDNNPGVGLKLGNCKYDQGGAFTFKLEGTLSGGTSKDAQDYEHLANVLALPTRHWNEGKLDVVEPGIKLPPLGTSFSINKETVTIVGARLKAKYNVVVQKLSDGKRTCYKAEDVARIYAKQQEKAHA